MAGGKGGGNEHAQVPPPSLPRKPDPQHTLCTPQACPSTARGSAEAAPRASPLPLPSLMPSPVPPPYPLLFRPVLLEKVWGGRRLARLGKNLPHPSNPFGESWELADMASTSASGAGGGAVRSIIANGPLAGQTLNQALTLWGDDLFPAGATSTAASTGFPLLIKFLDASENLSVQIHPSRAFLKANSSTPHANPYHLKTESWYIVDAEPGAMLYIGVKPGVSSLQFAAHVHDGTVADDLIALPAIPGECHTLPSGTMHALGAGVLVAEVQTPSDTTFRVFDWGREGRELHIEQSLACGTFADTPLDRATEPPPSPTSLAKDQLCGRLATTPFYTIDEARPRKGDELTIGYKCGTAAPKSSGLPSTDKAVHAASAPERFGCFMLMVLEGEGDLRSTSDQFPPLTLSTGQTALIPSRSADGAVLIANSANLRALRVGLA